MTRIIDRLYPEGQTATSLVTLALSVALLCVGLTSGPATAAELSPPSQAYALRFAGNRTAIAPPSDYLKLGSEYTMEAWIYVDDLSSTVIMGRGDERDESSTNVLMLADEGRFLEFAPVWGQSISVQHNIEKQTWAHVAVISAGETIRLFVDGEEIGSGASPGAAEDVLPFALGSEGGGIGSIQGAMAQVRLWNRMLTAAELQSNAQKVLTGDESGLVACWPLNDGSGQVAKDLGTNALHLTLGRTSEGDMYDPKWIGTTYLSNDPYFTVKAFPILDPTDSTEVQINGGVLIDCDSDGDLDVVVHEILSTQVPSRLLAYRNDGQGNLSEASAEVFGGEEILVNTTNNTNAFAVADFDNDGRMDLYVAGAGLDAPPFPGEQNRILMQTPDGLLRDGTAARLPAESALTHDLTIGDIDGDGDVDVFNANTTMAAPMNFYINDGRGIFALDASRIGSSFLETIWNHNAGSSELIDVDRDSDLDLVLGAFTEVTTRSSGNPDALLLNDGSGRFDQREESGLPARTLDVESTTVVYEQGDFNNDGWPDLLAWISMGPEFDLKLLLNNGDGTFRWVPDAIPQSEDAGTFVEPADFNGDGWLDFSCPGHEVRIYLNTGRERFVNGSDLLPMLMDGGGSGIDNALPGDLDGDGDVDLLLQGRSQLRVAINNRPYDVSAVPNPVISGFQPEDATVGTSILITGTDLSGATRVEFNGISTDFTVISHTEMTAIVPGGESSGAIRVTTPNGVLTTSTPFTLRGPSFGLASPMSGFANSSVVITGANYVGVTAVEFNGVGASFSVDASTRITSVVPIGATTGPIRIITIEGSTDSEEDFLVHPSPPDQTSVLDFGGSFNRIAVAPPVPTLELRDQFTLEAWVYNHSPINFAIGLVMGRPNHPAFETDPLNHYVLHIPPPYGHGLPQLAQSTGEPGSQAEATGQKAMERETWVHLAGTSDGDSIRLYVNGVNVASEHSPGPPAENVAVPFAVGNGATPDGGQIGSSWPGYLCQARVWGRALDEDEIQSNMGENLTGDEQGLIAYWPLDDGEGQIARDLGPHRIDLQLGTTPSVDDNDPLWVETPSVTAPQISDISPTGGPADTTVVITGTRFLGATSVTLAAAEMEFRVESNDRITAIVPTSATSGSIGLVTPGGECLWPSDFTVWLNPPTQQYVLQFKSGTGASTGRGEISNLGDDFTMETWVFVEDAAGPDIVGLEYFDPSGKVLMGYFFNYSDGLRLDFKQNTGDGVFAGAGIPAWDGLERWSHIAGTANSDSLRLFVDGVLVQSVASLGPPPAESATLALSQTPRRMRQLRLWNRSLTEDELRANAQQELVGREDGLVAYWPLDDGRGQNPRNLGPSNITLTLGWSTEVEDTDPVWVETGEALPAPAGDFNGDGKVGFEDFVIFAQRFGAEKGQEGYDAAIDLDGDDKIGFTDFVIFAQNFGKTAGG